jgi:hypothetical protein
MLLDIAADVVLPILFTNPATFAAADLDALPTFRVFGQNGPVSAASGTGAYLESKPIGAISVGATTTITSADHGLATGAVITISGATGTSNVNGTHAVIVVDANTFTFDDIESSGSYTSGASWHTPGLYGLTLDTGIRSALEVGNNYLLIAYGVFQNDSLLSQQYFTVVS